MLRHRALPILLLAALLLAGCGDDTAGPRTKMDVPAGKFVDSTGEKSLQIDVIDNSFQPAYVRIDPGTKVTWTNNGRNPHNVIPADKGAFGGAKTGDFGPGASYKTTFDKVGYYPYYCSIHGTKRLNGQAGVIQVVATG